MIFWAGILVAAAFAWLAVKIGFYETWAFAFNLLVSVYLAIFLGPVIADILPAAGQDACRITLTMAGTAIAAFLILHGISYIFFTSQFNTSFPKILDIIGSAFLGFLGGLLVCGFVSLLIFMMPISQSTLLKDIGFDSQLKQANISYVSFWCNLVNKVVSTQAHPCSTEDMINEALNKAQSEPEKETTDQPEDFYPGEAEAETTSLAEEPAEKADNEGY